MASLQAKQQLSRTADPRDRLILALYAQLKAERDTRETLEWVIGNGVDSVEVLEAIISDPVPASAEQITASDHALIDRLSFSGRDDD